MVFVGIPVSFCSLPVFFLLDNLHITPDHLYLSTRSVQLCVLFGARGLHDKSGKESGKAGNIRHHPSLGLLWRKLTASPFRAAPDGCKDMGIAANAAPGSGDANGMMLMKQ